MIKAKTTANSGKLEPEKGSTPAKGIQQAAGGELHQGARAGTRRSPLTRASHFSIMGDQALLKQANVGQDAGVEDTINRNE